MFVGLIMYIFEYKYTLYVCWFDQHGRRGPRHGRREQRSGRRGQRHGRRVERSRGSVSVTSARTRYREGKGQRGPRWEYTGGRGTLRPPAVVDDLD